jgi:hypothetical protein
MSYHRRPQALGLSWSDITGAVTKGADYAQKAVDYAKAAPGLIDATKGIIEDPYLKEAACNISRLKAVTGGQYPGPPCPPTPGSPDPKKGIGLRYAIKPLHMAVYARQNPWVVPLAAVAVLGIPFFLGMAVGKRRRG